VNERRIWLVLLIPLSFHCFLSITAYSTFPEEVESALQMDGIVIDHRTLPGCEKDGEKMMGIALIHEVSPIVNPFRSLPPPLLDCVILQMGHFMGLDHTFAPCESTGDGVDDTPAQLQATGLGGCPINIQDTCSSQPGFDDVANVSVVCVAGGYSASSTDDLFMQFMNHAADESCRNHFTNGQLARMMAAATKYRGYPLMKHLNGTVTDIQQSWAQEQQKKASPIYN
jgi:hypothetical protein